VKPRGATSFRVLRPSRGMVLWVGGNHNGDRAMAGRAPHSARGTRESSEFQIMASALCTPKTEREQSLNRLARSYGFNDGLLLSSLILPR